ncbi:MAG: helix-turn-helix transcriptional regulator [Lachnospiraceae bacterium]|nr:helix-turn-helix transcriptional regulator [Lachnospiraceae bacterium]
MPTSIILGSRIRFYRKEKKLSQEKLAEVCRLHPSYIGQIERGEKNITVEILHRLSLGLGVSMAELLQDIDGKEYQQDSILSEIYNQMFQISNGDLKRMKRLFDAVLDIVNH